MEQYQFTSQEQEKDEESFPDSEKHLPNPEDVEDSDSLEDVDEDDEEDEKDVD